MIYKSDLFVSFSPCHQAEPRRWRCTRSSWAWTGMASWGRKLNSYPSWRLRRTPVTSTVCDRTAGLLDARADLKRCWHCRCVSNSPIRALLSPGLRWRRWNQRRWIISGAPTVLLCGPPLQQSQCSCPVLSASLIHFNIKMYLRAHVSSNVTRHVCKFPQPPDLNYPRYTYSAWTPGVQQHGAPIHLHAVQPEPVVVREEPQWREGGAMGGQGSPLPRRWIQTFGWWREEGRWTQGEVREWNVRGWCPCCERRRITAVPCSLQMGVFRK